MGLKCVSIVDNKTVVVEWKLSFTTLNTERKYSSFIPYFLEKVMGEMVVPLSFMFVRSRSYSGIPTKKIKY